MKASGWATARQSLPFFILSLARSGVVAALFDYTAQFSAQRRWQ